jgi:hypothetical protein
VITAIEGHDMPEDFCRPGLVDKLFKESPIPERDPQTEIDRLSDRHAVWANFKEVGIAGLSEINRLSPEENRDLFYTPVIDRVVELVLTGLSRLLGRRG